MRSAPDSASMRSAVVTSTLDAVSRSDRGVRSPVTTISGVDFAGSATGASGAPITAHPNKIWPSVSSSAPLASNVVNLKD